MEIIERIQDAVDKLGGETKVRGTGSPEWKRVFVTVSGVQIGRASIHNGDLYRWKRYGDKCGRRGKLDEWLRFWLKLDVLMSSGLVISEVDIDAAEQRAQKEHDAKIKEKQEWRRQNPKTGKNTKRPRLVGPDIGGLTKQYVFERFINA